MGQPHFKREPLHQNAGMAFQQDFNGVEIGWGLFQPYCDAIDQIADAIGRAAENHTLIGKQQQILIGGHTPEHAG